MDRMKFNAFFMNKLDCLYSKPISFTKIYINTRHFLIKSTNHTVTNTRITN